MEGEAGSPETRFIEFNKHTVVYKTVNGHDIEAGVLIPKNIKPGSHPLLVHFHGGNLYTGRMLYPEWTAPYLVSLALAHSAIIVSANYRLIPESSGADILADLSDFWTWLQHSFPAFLASKSTKPLSVDFNHVLVTGESAGGWMSLQSAFTVPEGLIKAMILPYPVSRPLPGTGATEKFGMPIRSSEWLDDWLKKVEPGTVISSATPPARMEMGMTMLENGRMTEFLGTDKKFNPYERMDEAKHFPRTWVLHGTEDSVVPFDYSVKLVDKIEKMFPGKVRFTEKPGEHGFDIVHSREKDEWMKEALEWIEEAWL